MRKVCSVAELNAALERASRAEALERECRGQLLEMTRLVAEMKRAGFEAMAPVAVREKREDPIPADVIEAILERAPDGPVNRRLMMQAASWLEGGQSPVEVAARVRRGGNVDDLLYGVPE